jgi:hypothetical protein
VHPNPVAGVAAAGLLADLLTYVATLLDDIDTHPDTLKSRPTVEISTSDNGIDPQSSAGLAYDMRAGAHIHAWHIRHPAAPKKNGDPSSRI